VGEKLKTVRVTRDELTTIDSGKKKDTFKRVKESVRTAEEARPLPNPSSPDGP
jgi:hypothetical protein